MEEKPGHAPGFFWCRNDLPDGFQLQWALPETSGSIRAVPGSGQQT